MASSYPNFYLLPSSPDYKCDDRFSLHPTGDQIEDKNGKVPFWPVLQTILSQPINSTAGLIDILDTISVTLRGTSKPAGNYQILLEAISSSLGSCNIFFGEIWPRLVTIALEMPVLFPDGRLPVLGQDATNYLRLSRRQVACLVVHQFLRTLSVPHWRDDDGTHDFGIWYSSQQRHPVAVRAYLCALMLYFGEVVCEDGRMEDWVVEYSLHSLPERYDEIAADNRPLAELKVVLVEKYDTSPASLGVDDGDGQAVVISANKVVGFGQSATQEEVHVGISPEACPVVLVTPLLGDGQVLKVRGAQAMVNIVGKGRDIIVEPSGMPVEEGSRVVWKQRTMLFMDALELDLVDDGGGVADLVPENMEREISKAYTAFSSGLNGSISEIRTGLWGCGAFGGDPEVKMLLLLLAASMAGVKLTVVCELQRLAQKLQDVVHIMQQTVFGTVALRKLLNEIPKSLSRGQTLDWLRQGAQLSS